MKGMYFHVNLIEKHFLKIDFFLEIFIFFSPKHFTLMWWLLLFWIIDKYLDVNFHPQIIINKRYVISCKVDRETIFGIDTFLKFFIFLFRIFFFRYYNFMLMWCLLLFWIVNKCFHVEKHPWISTNKKYIFSCRFVTNSIFGNRIFFEIFIFSFRNFFSVLLFYVKCNVLFHPE